MIILRTWAKQPGTYFCISSKSPSGEWRDEFFKRSQFKLIPRYIKEMVEDECDVYWCPHGFSKPRRLKRNAVMPNLLWADIDDADVSSMPLKPSVLWESSPGRFAGLWFLSSVLSDDELNKRWTYRIGADKGGWDLTQVLRLPGTVNHKYPDKPKVKLIYEDPRLLYEEADVEGNLPKNKKTKKDYERAEDARQLFKRYRKNLTPWARREMLSGKPTQGKRSEVFWKLTNELVEAGASEEETFALLWASPWNKFRDRHDGMTQLQREINKVFDSKFDGSGGYDEFKEKSEVAKEEKAERKTSILSTMVGSAENKDTDWILYPYLAAGHLTAVEGKPEIGKSWFCYALATAIAGGPRPLPDDGWDEVKQKGLVLYFDAENEISAVKTRMVDSEFMEYSKNPHQTIPFFHIGSSFLHPDLGAEDEEDLIYEIDGLLDEIKESYKNDNNYSTSLKLMVFDTIQNYSSDKDSNKQHDVVTMMNNLKALAVHYGCAIMFIRHHGKGAGGKDQMDRGVGSIQFTASARTQIGIYEHPRDMDLRVITCSKTNIARRAGLRPLVYEMEQMFPFSRDVKQRDRTRMVWHGFEDIRDHELIMSQKEKDDVRAEVQGDVDVAKELLDTLHAKYMNGKAVTHIPADEVKNALENSNIPNLSGKNMRRIAFKAGYKPSGRRGPRSTYIRVDQDD